MIIDQEAHEGPIWSVALQPPEGKGFMTGADKIVKFWDFTVYFKYLISFCNFVILISFRLIMELLESNCLVN